MPGTYYQWNNDWYEFMIMMMIKVAPSYKASAEINLTRSHKASWKLFKLTYGGFFLKENKSTFGGFLHFGNIESYHPLNNFI